MDHIDITRAMCKCVLQGQCVWCAHRGTCTPCKKAPPTSGFSWSGSRVGARHLGSWEGSWCWWDGAWKPRTLTHSFPPPPRSLLCPPPAAACQDCSVTCRGNAAGCKGKPSPWSIHFVWSQPAVAGSELSHPLISSQRTQGIGSLWHPLQMPCTRRAFYMAQLQAGAGESLN